MYYNNTTVQLFFQVVETNISEEIQEIELVDVVTEVSSLQNRMISYYLENTIVQPP